MASADLLKSLFQSVKQGDHERFYEVANQIILEEKQKKHNVLARDLKRILEGGDPIPKSISSVSFYDLSKLPKDQERDTVLLEVREVDRILEDMILSDSLRDQLQVILREFDARERLYSYGLKPKQKLLFAGPPGCGKTMGAEVLSGELGIPLLYIRFDAVISSYLGETANNLRKIFDFASQGTWIVFFDEFDAIGKSRDNTSEHGELKRVVNTFLQLMDGFQSESIFVAATNHAKLLDSALWRRFDDILFFTPPSKDQITDLIRLKLRNFSHTVEYNNYVSDMLNWSHSDIERVCIDAIKTSIVDGANKVDNQIFEKALKQQKDRIGVIEDSSSNN